MDILKDQWSPALALKTLLSLQALLSTPEPDDPEDAVVAQQYLRDYPTIVGTARYWTETFAKSGSLGIQEKLAKLVEMGFSADTAKSALESCGGDETQPWRSFAAVRVFFAATVKFFLRGGGSPRCNFSVNIGTRHPHSSQAGLEEHFQLVSIGAFDQLTLLRKDMLSYMNILGCLMFCLVWATI